MSNDLLFWLIVLVLAGRGVGVRSFLPAWAKKIAPKKDIGDLTQITEGIKADIANKAWVEQKRWEIKQQFYWDAIGKIHDLGVINHTIFLKLAGHKATGSDAPAQELVDQLPSLMSQFRQTLMEFERLTEVASIVTSEDVDEAFNIFLEEAKKAEKTFQNENDEQYFIHFANHANTLRDQLKRIAKADLKISA